MIINHSASQEHIVIAAIERFKKNIRKDCFIDVIKLPRGKDVNDLSFEEFMGLETIW